MAQYSFVTLWKFDAPIDKVWEAIRQMDSWPEWWKYVKTVRLIKPGDENDIGSIRRITWTTALPYELTFDSELVALDHHKRIEGRAFGELSGVGIWIFEVKDDITHVRYDWIVDTTKKWMNFFAPVARPVFSWNHDRVMQAGFHGLNNKLSATNQIQVT